MQIQEILLADLREYENNPRNNDGAIQAVAESIKQFGWRVPLVVDKDNIIVAGHTRYRAAQLLGLDRVPCLIADDLTPEQVKAYRLADNKTAELAEWDFSALEIELAELSEMELDFDMSDFGFIDSEFDKNEEEVEGDEQDEIEEEINADSSYKYQEQYGVIVICESEEEQESTYNELMESGYKCKVVAV